jgi:hypothetical protein
MLQQVEITADDRQAIYQWVHDVCRLNLRMSTGETLLHQDCGRRASLAMVELLTPRSKGRSTEMSLRSSPHCEERFVKQFDGFVVS